MVKLNNNGTPTRITISMHSRDSQEPQPAMYKVQRKIFRIQLMFVRLKMICDLYNTEGVLLVVGSS